MSPPSAHRVKVVGRLGSLLSKSKISIPRLKKVKTIDASDPTSSSLLERVKAHDLDAWDRLVSIYSPLIFTWARKLGVRSEDADDILQEVLQAILGSIALFQHHQPDGTFRGWLWTITRNRIRSHFKEIHEKGEAVGGTDAYIQMQETPESEPEIDSSTALNKSNPLLIRSLEYVQEEFEDRTWQAFWRSTVDEVPTSDVADELGMSIGAVRIAKCRVLRRLREEMKGLFNWI